MRGFILRCPNPIKTIRTDLRRNLPAEDNPRDARLILEALSDTYQANRVTLVKNGEEKAVELKMMIEEMGKRRK